MYREMRERRERVAVNGGATMGSDPVQNDGQRRLRFGRVLADAMKARGMKQEDLACMLGTTQSSVSGWINGKYEPAAATVFTVERCLGVEPGSLSRPLGYLPVEPVSRTVSVEGAIAQSVNLDDEEKAALAAMYRLLVRGSARGGGVERPRNQRASANRSRIAPTPSAARPRSAPGGR
jgi:transcriptional regulator with XRE-family HTH domain